MDICSTHVTSCPHIFPHLSPHLSPFKQGNRCIHTTDEAMRLDSNHSNQSSPSKDQANRFINTPDEAVRLDGNHSDQSSPIKHQDDLFTKMSDETMVLDGNHRNRSSSFNTVQSDVSKTVQSNTSPMRSRRAMSFGGSDGVKKHVTWPDEGKGHLGSPLTSVRVIRPRILPETNTMTNSPPGQSILRTD